MRKVPALNKEVMDACQLYVDNLIKPIHSLGKIEEMAVRIAGITGEKKPACLQKAVVIFGGDTAVDGENKTKGELSLAEMKLVAQGFGPVNVAARMQKIPVYLIDTGLQKDTDSIEGVFTAKVIHGTHKGHPAMDREAAEQAVSTGMSVAHTLAVQGTQMIALGNIGERCMLSSLAVTTAIMKNDLEKISPGKGFSVRFADVGNFAEDPIGVLAQVGSAEIAGLFGVVVEAARERMGIVFDNAVTGAAVLGAVTVYPEIRDYIFPSAAYDEPVHQMQMNKLGLHPYLQYHFTEMEGFGSVLGLSLMDCALHMLNDMKTFGEGGVDVAVDGPGKGRQREDVK